MGKYPGLIPSVLTIFSLNEGKISDNNYQFIKFSMVKSISQMRLKRETQKIEIYFKGTFLANYNFYIYKPYQVCD